MAFFYKSYPCAPGATALSALCSCGTYISVIAAICLIGGFFSAKSPFFHNVALLILGVFLIALAAFLYFFLYRKKVPELAEKQTQQNIRTKADAAYIYCQRCPEAYDELRAINPAFAQKYERSETGKIVKTRR